jgi:hypothetical protein
MGVKAAPTTAVLPPLAWGEAGLWRTAVEVTEPRNAIEELAAWLEFQCAERELADTIPMGLDL